ncbi:peptidoglycan/LPS O-acetylase OafA/YrhL [Kutzneria viridogrisea]|uniref:Peptidoglycan/LPS O-acetylase OafA/YrhL n=1 Tax=Kutzneria viridogrisea TaxID=47990 RepID=A0ABR6BDV9_9PSEU|nr:peptidoglycan/LPS O-acetylase OafA/YrhL [Kutzneria viridogrisea]
MTTTARRQSWDVVRVLAISCVLVQHATHAGPGAHSSLGPMPVVVPIEVGASTLVVVSAYFVCVSMLRARPVRVLRNRAARLLPAYLVAATGTFCVLRLLAPPGWTLLRLPDLLVNLSMLQLWIPGSNMVDFSYWTLPMQLTGFLAAAVLFSTALGRGRPLQVLLWGLVGAPLLIRCAAQDQGPVQVVYSGLALHRAQLFAAGIGIFLWSRNRMSLAHLCALLAAALVAQWLHTEDLPSTLVLAALLAAICLAAAGPDWRLGVLARPIAWLGGISYGVYLVNQEVGYVVMDRVARWGGGPSLELAAFLGSALALGWGLTVLVERPAQRLLAGHSQAGSSGTSPASSPAPPRPVNQASIVVPEPRTTCDSPLPATSHTT